jgi:hypothetical protein
MAANRFVRIVSSVVVSWCAGTRSVVPLIESRVDSAAVVAVCTAYGKNVCAHIMTRDWDFVTPGSSRHWLRFDNERPGVTDRPLERQS